MAYLIKDDNYFVQNNTKVTVSGAKDAISLNLSQKQPNTHLPLRPITVSKAGTVDITLTRGEWIGDKKPKRQLPLAAWGVVVLLGTRVAKADWSITGDTLVSKRLALVPANKATMP